MTETYTFRDFLKDELKQRGLSASKFAQFVGVDTATITRCIDEANPQKPGIHFLLKLSRGTGRSLSALIELAYPEEAATSRLSPSAQLLAQQIEALSDDEKEAIRRWLRGRQE